MRLVHEPADGGRRVLATTVETADTTLEQSRGLMFRESIPEDYALVFDFEAEGDSWLPWAGGGAAYHSIHMVFVRFDIDVVWLLDGEVKQVKTLAPWTGLGFAKSDAVIELPAGAADGVDVGDRVFLADGDDPTAGRPADPLGDGETADGSIQSGATDGSAQSDATGEPSRSEPTAEAPQDGVVAGSSRNGSADESREAAADERPRTGTPSSDATEVGE